MADLTEPYSKLQDGTIPFKLKDNADGSYSLGTSVTGAGIGSINVPWMLLTDGRYPLKFVENIDGSYSLGTSNG